MPGAQVQDTGRATRRVWLRITLAALLASLAGLGAVTLEFAAARMSGVGIAWDVEHDAGADRMLDKAKAAGRGRCEQHCFRLDRNERHGGNTAARGWRPSSTPRMP